MQQNSVTRATKSCHACNKSVTRATKSPFFPTNYHHRPNAKLYGRQIFSLYDILHYSLVSSPSTSTQPEAIAADRAHVKEIRQVSIEVRYERVFESRYCGVRDV